MNKDKRFQFGFDLQRFANSPSGPVTTYDIAEERRGIDVTRRIKEERPDEDPFIVILLKARKRVTTHTYLRWWDDEPWAWWTKIDNDSGYDDSASDIVVDEARILAPKDIIVNTRTKEQMFVVTVDYQTNTVGVIRGYGLTNAAPILDGDSLMWLSNAMEQNSMPPQSKIAQPRLRTNNTQTVRTTFDESMQSATDDIDTDETERQRLRRKKLLDHRLSLERTSIWGQKHDDENSKRTLTSGIDSFILTNEFDAGGDLNRKKFFTELAPMVFRHGSKNKLMVCSPVLFGYINEFAMEAIRTSSGERTYGIDLNYINVPGGRLYFAQSQTFDRDFEDTAFVLDMQNIHWRPKRNRDTKLYPNIQPKGMDGWMDEYLTEFSVQVELEKTHTRIINALQ